MSTTNNTNSDLSPYATKSDLSSKANDSGVVHINGDEVIRGNKWFSGTSLYFNYKNVDNVRIFADGEGGNIRLTDSDNNYHYEFDTVAKNYLRLYGGNSSNELTGGFCFYPNGDFLPAQGSLQNLGSSDYKWKGIYGNVFYGEHLQLTKEIRYTDTTYDWSDPLLNTWCDAGHVSWFDRNGIRRIHDLIGTSGGVWRKACFINEQEYFTVNSNRDINFRGETFSFNGKGLDVIEEQGDGYIRYSNGIQICWGTVVFSYGFSAVFAKPFSSSVSVTSTVVDTYTLAYASCESLSNAGVTFKRSDGCWAVTYMAIGRWK